MVPTQAERRGRSRRAILDAAAVEFARHGFAAASLNRIIEASGLTKGGVYNHFPSKQDLALAVLEDQMRGSVRTVTAVMARHERAVDRLFEMPLYLADHPEYAGFPLGLRRVVEELSADPRLRDDVCRLLRLWVDTVTDQFRDAQEEGTVRRDLDAAVLGEVAVGAFTGMQAMTDQLRDGQFARRIRNAVEVVKLATLVDQPERPPGSGRGTRE
jgi:AcrR family transcriptional regulator